MRKILLLSIIITLISCTKTFRSDDIFIIYAKENRNTTYKYLYRVRHYSPSTKTKNGLFYETDYVFVSNDDYELGDTIKFNRHTYNEK
jgi:hypothetical protein